ncbi:MAG: hypothetical protein ACJ75H_08610 [Thermoanaerobaculia bacterium]
MSEHLTPPELEAFLTGSLSPGRFKQVVRHLITGCPDCCETAGPGFELLEAIDAEEPLFLADQEGYDEAIDRAFRSVGKRRRHFRREMTRSRETARLLESGTGLKGLVDEGDRALKGLGDLKALLDRSWAMRHENPREMVSLARAAVEVARRLDPRQLGINYHADIQSQVWGELGNALRVADDLEEAERAFGVAFEFLVQGTGDLYLKARLNDLHASFLGTRRRFVLAFSSLDVAHLTYLEIGEPHMAGRAMLTKAIYTYYKGDPIEALRLNEEGLKLINENRDPSLLAFALHNQLSFLVGCGRFPDAKRELFDIRPRLERTGCGGAISALKMRWLQGQIGAGLQEWQSAELAFQEVRNGFEEAGMGFAAALVSFELSLLLLRQNRYEEAKEVALDSAEVFTALRAEREVLGALLVVQDSFRMNKATVDLLEDFVNFLKRFQIDPDAKFAPR